MDVIRDVFLKTAGREWETIKLWLRTTRFAIGVNPSTFPYDEFNAFSIPKDQTLYAYKYLGLVTHQTCFRSQLVYVKAPQVDVELVTRVRFTNVKVPMQFVYDDVESVQVVYRWKLTGKRIVFEYPITHFGWMLNQVDLVKVLHETLQDELDITQIIHRSPNSLLKKGELILLMNATCDLDDDIGEYTTPEALLQRVKNTFISSIEEQLGTPFRSLVVHPTVFFFDFRKQQNVNDCSDVKKIRSYLNDALLWGTKCLPDCWNVYWTEILEPFCIQYVKQMGERESIVDIKRARCIRAELYMQLGAILRENISEWFGAWLNQKDHTPASLLEELRAIQVIRPMTLNETLELERASTQEIREILQEITAETETRIEPTPVTPIEPEQAPPPAPQAPVKKKIKHTVALELDDDLEL